MDKTRWIVVGSTPHQSYTGTVTYAGLKSLGIFNTEEEASKCVADNYNPCGGLIEVFEIKEEL